jgi:hypothetical protein
MKRLAVFVEGQTEQLFVEKLLEEIAGANRIRIFKEKIKGGKTCPKTITCIRSDPQDQTKPFYALIVDCSCDNRVKSEIRDQYDSLTRRGYTVIIGIRDVFPDDLVRLETGLYYGLPTKPVAVEMILAKMEIEAWFLAEISHYERIHPDITLRRAVEALGFDPSNDPIELRPQPSVDLKAVYMLEGLPYDKSRDTVQRTVDALDYAEMLLETWKRVGSLKRLLDALDSFLTVEPGTAS